MVVEVLGVLGEASGGGGWLKNGWKATGKLARIRHSNRGTQHDS